ncbi:MAG: CvpA family protein [Flavobacterium sp.]
MSFFDIVLGGLLAFGFIRGLKNGFFLELSSFVAWFIGLIIAAKFSNYTKIFLSEYVSWNPKKIEFAAFILTFVLVVLAISFLAKFITSISNFVGLGIINKLAGSIIGTLKIALILSVFLSYFEKINFNNVLANKQTLDKSLFFNPIQKTGILISPFLESGIKEIKKKI